MTIGMFYSIIILKKSYWLGGFKVEGSLRQGRIPAKPRFRSVPDVVVLNSQLLTELLIKYQRLPRGFLWNTSLPSLVC